MILRQATRAPAQEMNVRVPLRRVVKRVTNSLVRLKKLINYLKLK